MGHGKGDKGGGSQGGDQRGAQQNVEEKEYAQYSQYSQCALDKVLSQIPLELPIDDVHVLSTPNRPAKSHHDQYDATGR
jgi:hypothetical protein